MASFSFLVASIFLCSLAAANEVTVGGKSGEWKIPPSSSNSFTEWAQKARFKAGDFIVFRYQAGKDSVLQVTQEAYKSCSTTNPLANYTDGETKVKLDRSGPFYFISGVDGHCEKGQKVSLVVVSPRHKAISPAPSPVEFEDGPSVAPAPTSGSARLGGGFVLGLVLGLWAWF
ncbi:Early nodulin-like protein 1 [Raphanus sativus]|uniref:Early nodulin-like protein 14 n=1 Tax=Raphanus sativus TaxID=3726 RepID=A0A6J0K0J4_RAPSA|nr:early nodulin-like protein 14 [Raphanus sativus]KAJ4890643.1 Early nodulin-like protein 1 [Raphanus sativus]